MSLIDIILLGIGLAMDAFAVSVCKGLAQKKVTIVHAMIAGLWFGGFQALMPAAGYLLGSTFSGYIMSFGSWIAFILLAIIGVNMIREAVSGEEDGPDASMTVKVMFMLAVATSIDALSVGVSFAFLEMNVLLAVFLIGIITFVISAAGVFIGSKVGSRFDSKARIAGGIILIIIGLKILLS